MVRRSANLLLVLATLAALALVPDWPHRTRDRSRGPHALAVLGNSRATLGMALWLGCVLHGLWDAAHFGRVGFVPEWYAAACLAADVGLGAFVLMHLRTVSQPEGG